MGVQVEVLVSLLRRISSTPKLAETINRYGRPWDIGAGRLAMAEPLTVAVVGSGFSGVMTAVHLLRGVAPRPVRVLMVNRSGVMARGVAYGTSSPAHLLNVPAGKMSAFPEDPSHFVRYAQSQDATITAGTFVRRSIYGSYLEYLLTEAAAGRHNTLEQIVTEVRGVEPDRAWATIITADGRRIAVDRVVLAVGHYPPAHPGLLAVIPRLRRMFATRGHGAARIAPFR